MKISIPAPTDADFAEIYQHDFPESVQRLSEAFRSSEDVTTSLITIVELTEELRQEVPESLLSTMLLATFRSTFSAGFAAGYLFALLKSGQLTPPVSKETDGSGI